MYGRADDRAQAPSRSSLPPGYAEFHQQFGTLITALAAQGWTPSETHRRIRVLFPQVNREHLDFALDSGMWEFGSHGEQTPTHVLLATAVWYAVAEAYGLAPDGSYAATTLDATVMADMMRLLESARVSPQNIALILGKVGAGLKYLALHPYTQLDELTYRDVCQHLPAESQDVAHGSFVWPPSCESIRDQLGDGGWSTAMLRTGVCPPDYAEYNWQLGGTSLTDMEFRNQLGSFMSYCIRYDRQPTVLAYGTWSTMRSNLGRVPFLAAVRAKYGSWHTALQVGRTMVTDALQVTKREVAPVRVPPHPPSISPEQLAVQGIGVVKSEQTVSARDRWDEVTNSLGQRLASLPWSRHLRTYYVLTGAAHANAMSLVCIYRSPAGFLCEIAMEAEVLPKFSTDYLRSRGWAAPTPMQPMWNRNVFDPHEAAQDVVQAMRWGMGCSRWDYYRTDDLVLDAEDTSGTEAG